MPINSRAKGKKGEQEFINTHLRPFWPDACRNADQTKDDKNDCLNVAGVHWQIKRTEAARVWDWIGQAEGEAAETDLPIVAFRRNRSRWYCVVDAEVLVALLKKSEDSA